MLEHATTDEREIFTLTSGVRVRFTHVNSMTIQRAADSVPVPPVYVQANKGPNGLIKYSQNPNHPDYKAKLAEADKDRSLKVLETMVLFGVELVDPLPANDSWFQDLSLVLDLAKYYTENEDGTCTIGLRAKIMLYVIHVAAGHPSDFKLIATHTIVPEPAGQERKKTF